MSRSVRRFLARHRRNPAISSVIGHLRSAVRGYDNFDYDHMHNGESFVLGEMARCFPDGCVIFDVGANEGEWSELALGICPRAEIHAFELVPSTFSQLEARLGNRSRVHLNGFGLAEQSGSVTVKVTKDNTRSTMVLDAELEDAETVPSECRVETGDQYLGEGGIPSVDFLKIDTEGAEPYVLKGFSQALASERIGLIQFEYGRINIATRFLLANFYALLEPLGFEIGKLYPDYVDFRPYATAGEDFMGPNYIAVNRRHTELRSRLSGM